MRPILHGDLTNAARVLMRVAEADRDGVARQMIEEAERAFDHMTATGRAHPDWGDGSLMSAARMRGMSFEPTLDNLAYCSCLETVLRSLKKRRLATVRIEQSGY